MVKTIQFLLRDEEKLIVEEACRLVGIAQASLARSLLLERSREILNNNNISELNLISKEA